MALFESLRDEDPGGESFEKLFERFARMKGIVNVQNNSDTLKIVVIILKFEQCGFYHRVIYPQDADGMANRWNGKQMEWQTV